MVDLLIRSSIAIAVAVAVLVFSERLSQGKTPDAQESVSEAEERDAKD